MANWRHRLRSKAYEAEAPEIRALIRQAREFLAGL
jgi:hypothetical protein